MNRIRQPVALLLVLGVVSAQPVLAKTEPWKATLTDSLNKTYLLSKTSFSFNRIKEPGTVLVVQKEGLSGNKAGEGFSGMDVVDGKITQRGSKFGLIFGSNRRSFKIGDKQYITTVTLKDAEIQFDLVTFDTYDVTTEGTTKAERYTSQVHFKFAEGYLDTAQFVAIKGTIFSVLAKEDELKAASPATVALDQTPAQVESALGKPEKVIDLGTKLIYVYKDMKVVFVDGKVSDVQ